MTCPHCNSNDAHMEQEHAWPEYDMPPTFFVRCFHCGKTSPQLSTETPQQAIEEWNDEISSNLR